MQEKLFEYNNHKIAYTEWGQGERLLVCVHGLTRNARDFDWLARALAPHYKIICPSMPGRGASDWLTEHENYNNDYYAHATLALIESLGHHEFDWVGTSMGGLIGMVLAVTHPKLIGKMVLNDIGAEISEDGMRRIKTYVRGEVRYENQEIAQARFREIFESFKIETEEDWQHMFAHSLRQTEDGQYSFNYDPAIGVAFPEPQHVDLWRIWEAIATPTLILRGGESDILSHDVAEKMAEAEHAKLVVFDGYGHVPPLISQSQINVVKEFLCS